MTRLSPSAAPADHVADSADPGDAADFAERAVVVEQARVTLEVLGGKWVVPIVGVLSSVRTGMVACAPLSVPDR